MRNWGGLSVVGVLLAASAMAVAQTPTQTEDIELKAADASVSDDLGWSVAIGSEWIVAGATLDDDQGLDSGSAYVWRKIAGSWSLLPKLLPSDGLPGNHFGHSVSVNGNLLAVGAQLADFAGADAGAAYVFRWSGSAWTQAARLTATDAQPGDSFGQSVATDGVRVIVGADFEDDDPAGGCCANDSGAAYIFRDLGFAWVQEARLKAPDGAIDDHFGYSVAIDGDVAVVGSRYADSPAVDRGAAYVFRRNPTTGVWAQEAKLSGGNPGAQFGISVAISGDVIVAGAEFDDAVANDSGSAFVFRRQGTAWPLEKELTASTGAAGDSFGVSVDVDADLVAIGAYRHDAAGPDAGAGFVYRWTGEDWVEERVLLASDGSAALAHAVGISGATAVAGAYLDDSLVVDSGSVYVFDPASAWLNVKFGLGGIAGTPLLWGSGTLQPSTPVSLHLRDAPPTGSPVALILGFSLLQASFKGGVMVPHPDIILAGLPTSGGQLDLLATWPAGVPSGFVTYFQFWMADGTAVAGFSASNGTSGTAP